MAERYVSALTGPEMDAALLDMAQHNSEAWAVGTRNGAAVSSSDDTYQNNSKYYATEAEAAAARAEAAVPAGTEGAVLFSQAQSLTDAQKVQARSNISAGQGGTNPNLIDNPWFTVNQRGITSLTGSGYIADRWNAPWGQATYTVNADGSITIGHGREGQFLQRIALPPNALAGKTITLSLMLGDGTIGSWTRTVPSGAADVISASFGGRAFGFSSAASGTAYGYTLWIYTSPSSTTDFTLKAAKLEIGSISTLANDALPNYAEELLKCQRYFLRVLRNGGYSVDVGFGVADSTTTARITIPTPVPMAKNPTVSMSGTVRIQDGGSGHEITNISNYQSITNVGVQIHPTTTGLTNGDNVILSLGSNGAYIDLSADF